MEKFKLNKIYTYNQISETFKNIKPYGEDLIGGHFLLCKVGDNNRYAFVSAGQMFAGGLSYKLVFIYPPEINPR